MFVVILDCEGSLLIKAHSYQKLPHTRITAQIHNIMQFALSCCAARHKAAKSERNVPKSTFIYNNTHNVFTHRYFSFPTLNNRSTNTTSQ